MLFLSWESHNFSEVQSQYLVNKKITFITSAIYNETGKDRMYILPFAWGIIGYTGFQFFLLVKGGEDKYFI